MPGKILIADTSTTNRITLKAKLTAAYYQVILADSVEDAVALTGQHNPDLLLVGSSILEAGLASLMHAGKSNPERPIIVFLSENDPLQRLNALHSGAIDVICHPFDEPVLLASLRNHLRMQIAEYDLRENTRSNEDLGFSDTNQTFTHPMTIALFSPRTDALTPLGDALALLGNCSLARYHPDTLSSLAHAPPQADVYLLAIEDADTPEADLRRLSRLRSASSSRSYRILTHLQQPNPGLTSTVLDLGANDVVDASASIEELALRLHRQARGKQHTDKLREQLRIRLDAAITDSLTGLYNRRYAEDFLKQEIDNARLNCQHFTVMLADLDHLKPINDQYGHLDGDKVLMQVAANLRNTLQDHDMIARFGGDEFLIVLPNASPEHARNTADTLRRNIREMPITLSTGNNPIHVTISIGITFAPRDDGRSAPYTIDTLLKQADKALYQAKSEGRNTVTFDVRSAA
ncbi:diguanylate cyclase [Roseovarius sp. EL26]|uniref:diguanylate cyclase domain-containing protein n=1 Tax=Roseovarius sp. EL26 TaxID=2126672 RepID=UPI0013C47855|nr:diguanylate cyclase [Roseovarius sp. EL26]